MPSHSYLPCVHTVPAHSICHIAHHARPSCLPCVRIMRAHPAYHGRMPYPPIPVSHVRMRCPPILSNHLRVSCPPILSPVARTKANPPALRLRRSFHAIMNFPFFLLTSRDVFSAFEGGEDARHALLCGAIRVNLGLGF